MTSIRQDDSSRGARRRHYVLRLEPSAEVTAQDWVENWNWAVRISVVGLFALALAVVANYAASVMVPLVVAWVVATVLLPVVEWSERRGLPPSIVSIVLVIVLIVVVMVLVGLLTVPLTYWVSRTTELGALLKQRLESLAEPLAAFEEINQAFSQALGESKGALEVNLPSANIVTVILSTITPVIGETVIFLFALIFNLIYQHEIQDGVAHLFKNERGRMLTARILKDIEINMSIYFGTLTVVNICLGTATTLLAWIVGLPHPILWGVLAATMNYIPYIGAAVVIATLFVVGLMVFPTLGHAIIAPVGYLALTSLEGQFITPTILGHRLTINPFLVFVSIVVTAWIWGPVGAFVGVPMLMCAMVVIRRLSGQPQQESVEQA